MIEETTDIDLDIDFSDTKPVTRSQRKNIPPPKLKPAENKKKRKIRKALKKAKESIFKRIQRCDKKIAKKNQENMKTENFTGNFNEHEMQQEYGYEKPRSIKGTFFQGFHKLNENKKLGQFERSVSTAFENTAVSIGRIRFYHLARDHDIKLLQQEMRKGLALLDKNFKLLKNSLFSDDSQKNHNN
ncbi:hypothetical protein M0811_11682 [Anaeramoeba ignava]|uniref:Uncharacterized protein n=1 Tax=Anaeramoeba ignava TaxID=1746090 RepID=A0A9Q0R6U0_ANAIG|nr:hypothetical protein M0811_11682 [Anaeramoeba ignava]